MKRIYLFTVIVFAGMPFMSCSKDHGAAKQHLTNARSYLSRQEFEKAKAEIDSINILYPRSFDQRKAGILLLDSIRKTENNFIIEDVDRQLSELSPSLEEMKKDFVFRKDEKYQETGAYVPKATAGDGTLSFTTLHSGVEEDGQIYLESIFIGNQKHNKLKVTAGDQSAETLVIEGDGFVHRFADLGKNYEIIRITGNNENGVAKFIADNAHTNLKVSLSGQHSTSYTLSQNIKNDIRKSYLLSTRMLLIDSLKAVREKAEFRNFYLNNDKQLETPLDSEPQM